MWCFSCIAILRIMGALHRFGSHPNAQTVWNFGIFKFQKCPGNHIPVRDRFHCLSFPLLSVVSAAIKSVQTLSDSQLAAVLSLQSLGLCLFRGRAAFPDFTQGCSSPTSQTGDFHPRSTSRVLTKSPLLSPSILPQGFCA